LSGTFSLISFFVSFLLSVLVRRFTRYYIH